MLTCRVFGMRMAAAIAGLATIIVATVPAARADDKVVVFAAASLKNALDAVNAEWQKEAGKEHDLLRGKLGTRQADRGRRPGRHLRSADPAWMDYVAEKNLIKDNTRANLLGNPLVLVTASRMWHPSISSTGIRPEGPAWRGETRDGRR